MPVFKHFQDQLTSYGIDLHPSELHGLLMGYLCAVKKQSKRDGRVSVYRSWMDDELPAEMVDLLEEAFNEGLENLEEFSDFDFKLLLPDDDASIGERAAGVGLWCSGFLSGFGETGRQLDVNEKSDVHEAMRDLASIAAMTDDVPEGEENEADLMEIVEFVRVSTLLIFAETGSMATTNNMH